MQVGDLVTHKPTGAVGIIVEESGTSVCVVWCSDPLHKDEGEDETIHRGIAKRHFTRSFTVADDVEVKGAEMVDGMLKIALEKIVPEGKRPRTIDIS